MHFGEHITIDGYGGNFEKLNDKELILNCLNDLPMKLEMHKMLLPLIHFTKGNDTKDPGGWSGVVLIEESHISIHTFPAKGFLSADVYTCKNGMNTDFILKYFKDAFDLKDIEHNFIKRGLKYGTV